MMQSRLRWQLDRVSARYRRLRTWQVLALVWLGAALLGAGILAARRLTGMPFSAAIPLVCLTPCVLAALGLWWAGRSARNDVWIARQIESRYPDLGTCLLAAIELRPELPDGRYGFLQASVIQQALDHSRRHPWSEIVSRRELLFAALANVATFLLFLVAVIGLAKFLPPPASASAMIPAPLQSLLPGQGFTVTVEPGDTEVEKGTSLLVLARIAGTMPPSAVLHYDVEGGEAAALPMAPSLDDPVFGGRIPLVEQDLTYRVEVQGEVSPTYHAKVFEYPRLERADARLVFPKYTGLEERLVQDVRTISVVEGTELTLRCLLNKGVASATLTAASAADKAAPLVLVPSQQETLTYEATLTCLVSRKLKLELVDDAGRKNQKVTQFTINVNPNRPPTVKPLFPGKDLDVSALEELDLKASVWDDFGVPKMGLSYSLAGQEPADVVLMEEGAAKQKHEISSQVRLEELGAEPDQLLSYFWWAEDLGPDGEVRRTMSDMYFAEVRAFDEIFRQGQQPPGGAQQQQQQGQGQGQNAQQAQELAKLQKDIINATWKVIRREIGSTLSPAFGPDLEQIHLSQQTAIDQATALAEKLQDEKSKGLVEEVLRHMKEAAMRLQGAHEQLNLETLRPALPAEQGAYQALLKLRAREHEVVRAQQQQGQQGQQGQQSGQRQQQMQQLDLKDEENRYETERAAQAQKQESAEERENRQVLNRLKELARRQDDLNERLKELQTALEAAKTEQQKEDVRQQLKRLQDEQRQILQDTDELQSRVDQPENAERLSEERQQLEETREQVRRASEALEKEKVTQAAASGTRAQQQFDELREEFRRKASSGFNEEMKQMRDAARALDDKEKELSQRLAEEAKPPENDRSLREPTAESREKLATDLAEQRKRLETLQEQMRDAIDRAAETEPLLSERLYETARNLRDKEIDRALQVTERAVRQGMAPEARQIESIASEGIRQLREGIEKAAEGVLGDETEALRRARAELQDLARELNQEMVRNGAEPGPQPGNPQNAAGEVNRRPDGQVPPDGTRQPGERPGLQPGERPEQQPGDQPGEGERNQANPGERPGNQPGSPMPGNQEGSGEPMPMENRRPGNREGGQAGQRPGEQPGEQPGSEPGERPGETGQRGQQGQEGRGQGQQPGQEPGEGEPSSEPGQPSPSPGGARPGRGRGQRGEGSPMESPEGTPSQQPGEQPDGQQPGESQTGRGRPAETPQRGGRQQGNRNRSQQSRAGANVGGGSGPFEDYDPSQVAPLTGEDFRDWSDRLRDVEEMVDDPELRAQAARIREQARMIRAELKRHSAPPNWDIVRKDVAAPLVELEQRVASELLRRAGRQALVPLDRDPVPPQYSEKARKYYQRLGSGLTGADVPAGESEGGRR